MKFPGLRKMLPDWKSAALAVLSAILLILSFPDFEFWFLAWFGLVPLLLAIVREKESAARGFVLGWLWGFIFFTGTCWWLTYAPIHYADGLFPAPLAYFLLVCLTAFVAIFSGIFALFLSVLAKRSTYLSLLVAPSIWVFTEFLRYWITGNNWNAIGYSQAFVDLWLPLAAYGGVAIVSFFTVSISSATLLGFTLLREQKAPKKNYLLLGCLFLFMLALHVLSEIIPVDEQKPPLQSDRPAVVAIQPNVPMSGLTEPRWRQLRAKHIELAEAALATINANPKSKIQNPKSTVIFPESPMNFMWEEDEEFRNFVHAFAAKNNVQVLFNSAEPDGPNNKYFNSAVLVGPDGKEIAQYDKIYLLPFGESVPAPLQSIVPAFVGSFSYGKEYDLLPLGDAKAGVMICFESHFGELSREYVRRGADVLIEMTNDGYLGPTPVLRQHLANAVFRAVETNRPVLRVTNVGITAYINERGEILDPADSYTDTTRVWSVGKSNGSQTFYVKYGDWFAWLCSIVSIGLLAWCLTRRQISGISDN